MPSSPSGGSHSGSLTIVGTGIRPPLHTTMEAMRAIERADRVLYLLAEAAPTRWIHDRNESARSLAGLYGEFEQRDDVYEAIVDEVMTLLGEGHDVCLALYGHPGVFVSPSHDALARAREEGYPARMLPGVSAEDCLFADLGVDPAEFGCQSFEATDFLVRQLTIDPAVPLVLWQISVIGEFGTAAQPSAEGIAVLATRLAQTHGPDHEVIVYEATPFPVGGPVIERIRVAELDATKVTPLSTLYVPPSREAPFDAATMERLGIPDGD